MTRIVRPGGQSLTFNRQACGQLESLTDSAGARIDYRWNTKGQLLSAATDDHQKISYSYNGAQLEAITFNLQGTAARLNVDYESVQDGGWTSKVLTGRVGTMQLLAGGQTHNIEQRYDADGLLTVSGPLSLGREVTTGALSALVLGKTTTTHQVDAWGQLLRATTHMQGVNFSPELANNRPVIRSLILALSDHLSTHITERADCIVLRPAEERLCEVVPVRRPLTQATAKAATESISCIPQGVSITRADLADEYHLPWPPRAPEWSGTDACLLQLHASTEALIADIDANLSPASIQARVGDLAARFASGPSQYINASDVPTPTPSTFYTSYIDASAQALLDQISATLTPWLGQNPQWSTALEHTHTYDALGRITHTQEVLLGNPQADTSYSYDPQGRLSVVTAGAATTTWSYDANGNRTHENGILIAHYDNQDQLIDWRGTTYHYNAAGDLRQQTTANGSTTYHYDAQGNLRHVTLEDGRVIDYAIDPNNRRTGKSLNGQRQWQLVWQSPLRPIALLKANGTLEALYYYADKPNVPEAMDKDGKTYRIVSDHLGSVRLVIDTDTGQIRVSTRLV